MKKQLLLLVMILLPVLSSAQDAVEIDGIYYNLISKGGTNGAEVTYSNGNGYTGTIVIPETVSYNGEMYNVNSIGNYAFSGCKKLSGVTIPPSVLTIGKEAFSNCDLLTSINIPSSVVSIDENAFRYCRNLKAVYITDLEAWCNISFPDRYYIESNPLFYAQHLFLNNEEIKDLVIPSNITKIKSFAFVGCAGLSSLTIHQNVTSIGYTAFYGCSGLSSLFIPDNVVTIGDYAFENCSSVTSLRLPSNLYSIGEYTFYNCKELQSITWPIYLSNIEKAAFACCSSLTSLFLPDNVRSIKEGAFSSCSSIKSVKIGEYINSIDEGAFGYCEQLTDVYCYASVPPTTHMNAFEKSYIEYANLHVPESSIDAYKTTNPWTNFKVIVSIEGGDTPAPQKCEKPTISYNNGQLRFSSATDGAECVTTISDTDVKTHYGNAISLTATYNLSVYATKTGYNNSETATATLCWIDKEPTTEGITDGVAQISSKAVLIQSEGGILKVEGIDDGAQVSVYTPDGKQAGSAVCRNGAALVGTNIQPGNTAIVKIGEKSVKVVIK